MNTRFHPSPRSLCLICSLAAGLALIPACEAPDKSGEKKVATPITAPAGSYAFWPAFPDEPRIQFLRSFGTSDDVSPSQASTFERMVFGKDVEKTAMINKPYGVAMKDGKIYVCDIRGKSLVILDLRKKQTRLVGVSGANHLVNPVAVAVADDGAIYVADNERGAVIVYDANERYAASYGFPKFKPVSLALHGDRLYACDLAGQKIEVFDRKTGQRTGSIGSVGDGQGQFRVPLGIAADSSGNIYVSDMMACRVQKFSPDGAFLASMGSLGDHAGSFARPKHMTVDPDGIQYVVDAAFQNVQMFDSEQRVLMAFGAAGPFPGAMDLPAGVAINEDSLDLFQGLVHPGFEARRLVIVSNQFGPSKISVYALGETKKGWTPQQLAANAVALPSGMGMSEDRMKLQQAVGTLPDEGGEPGADGVNPPEPDETQPPPAKPKTP